MDIGETDSLTKKKYEGNNVDAGNLRVSVLSIWNQHCLPRVGCSFSLRHARKEMGTRNVIMPHGLLLC